MNDIPRKRVDEHGRVWVRVPGGWEHDPEGTAVFGSRPVWFKKTFEDAQKRVLEQYGETFEKLARADED